MCLSIVGHIKVALRDLLDVFPENREIAHDISITEPCICQIHFSIIKLTRGLQRQKRGRPMNTAQRLHMIRIITKIDNHPDFSKKIGVKNTSAFKPEKNNSKKDTAGK
jgi:hypothetical protein